MKYEKDQPEKDAERIIMISRLVREAEKKNVADTDLLFDALLTGVYVQKPYFDFGISNEDGGRRLNRGLIDQKEGFGARAVAHDHYAIDLAAWEPGRLTRAMS